MKILTRSIRTLALTTIIAVPFLKEAAYSQTPTKQDSFERSVPVSGSSSEQILNCAPSPSIKIAGVEHSAKIVVDLNKNILYKYDKEGKPLTAYLVASGKKASPTHTGVRIVTHTETYPYKSAPATSKRRQTPNAFGPRIICLNIIDPLTGEQSSTGEFIHGNNNKKSLGKYVSHGCIRMDNEVIKELANEVKRGDIVVII